MRNSETPDSVVYLCDQCGTEAPANVIRPRDTEYVQAVQPVGWMSLEARYSPNGAKRPRLRADLCSAACAHKQINEWSDVDEGD